MSKLLPCPFCEMVTDEHCESIGTKKEDYMPIVQQHSLPWMSRFWIVECLNCGATGGSDNTKNGAVEAWNSRLKPLPTEEQIAEIDKKIAWLIHEGQTRQYDNLTIASEIRKEILKLFKGEQ